MDGMEREKVWHVRIAVAAALVGCAGVVSGLRHELGLGWAVGLLTACILGVALALRDVHHRVDQEEAGRQVFYAGRGSTAWFAVVMVGVAIVPGMVIPLLADGAATALGVGLFAAVLTGASVFAVGLLSLDYGLVSAAAFGAVGALAQAAVSRPRSPPAARAAGSIRRRIRQRRRP
mgnify:CR=1 FL=1